MWIEIKHTLSEKTAVYHRHRTESEMGEMIFYLHNVHFSFESDGKEPTERAEDKTKRMSRKK